MDLLALYKQADDVAGMLRAAKAEVVSVSLLLHHVEAMKTAAEHPSEKTQYAALETFKELAADRNEYFMCEVALRKQQELLGIPVTGSTSECN